MAKAAPAPQPVPALLVPPTPELSPEALKASYGFVGAMADAIPELKGILQQAVSGQWTTDRFIMAVSSSGWYRQNSDAAREWITLQTVDPATAQAKHIRTAGDIWTLAWQNGIQLSDQQAAEAALWKIMNPTAPEDATVVHLARTYFDPNQDWNKLTGKAAGYANQIQQIGRQYGWDDFDNYDQSRGMLGQLMRGEDTLDGVKRKMLDFAKVKYPGLHDQLLAGATVQDLAQPYMSEYSKILEVPATSINWYTDKLVQDALQFRPANGGNSGNNLESNGTMPINEFQKKLRTDPRWRKTDNALDSTSDLIQKIGKDWGYYAE